MAFSVLATFAVALVVALILAAGMSPVLAVPLALVAGGVLFTMWGAASRMRHGKIYSGSAPSGVPSTREASYDPGAQH